MFKIANGYSEERKEGLIQGICVAKSSPIYLRIIESLKGVIRHTLEVNGKIAPPHPNPEVGDVIYTLGTSTRPFADFLALFLEHEIKVGVDVRSFPTSCFPHFRREFL